MPDDAPPPTPTDDGVPAIRTARMDLVSLGPREVEAFLAGTAADVFRASGVRVPADAPAGESVLRRRLAQLRDDPSQRPWLLRVMVERASRTLCGRIGFHGPPGPMDLGGRAVRGVELGYEVVPAFRRRGLAREAAVALMRWAYDLHAQRAFFLSVSPENGPSLAMARSLGFVEHGSQMDEEDGLELCFHRVVDAWPSEW